MSFDLELKGKRALVTGGTKGLGAALVKSPQDAGVEVMTSARSAPEKPVQGLVLTNITGTTAKGITLQHARDVTLRDIHVTGFSGPLLATADVTGTGLDGAASYVPPTPPAK